ncbi:activator of Hsp90 ATPase protein 1, partial [Tremellales sp. Uapishka_1]
MAEPTPLTAYQQTYHWRVSVISLSQPPVSDSRADPAFPASQNKNCAPWAHEWLKSALVGASADDGKQSVEVVEVTSVTGDCDLGQRKGKLLTIYDMEVEMKWKGVDGDGEDIEGTLKVPEVSHEAFDGLSDYVFDFNLTSARSAATTATYQWIRSALPPHLKEKFSAFRPALLTTHGNNAASAEGTPTPAPSGSNTPAPAPAHDSEKKEPKSVLGTTATVEVHATLQASAEDIWGLLTDEKKIPMWSRSPAKMTLAPGTSFELFGGNIVGKITEVEQPTKLVQSWQVKSPSWPSGGGKLAEAH